MGRHGGASPQPEEFFAIVGDRGWKPRPTNEVLIEEIGVWVRKNREEVVRDSTTSCIIICSIENILRHGRCITAKASPIEPALTLTDKEDQRMRSDRSRLLRRNRVETGGSKVQFAVIQRTGPQSVGSR